MTFASMINWESQLPESFEEFLNTGDRSAKWLNISQLAEPVFGDTVSKRVCITSDCTD